MVRADVSAWPSSTLSCGAAEAVLAAADDAEQVRHFAERMQVEAMRLSQLVQDVIDLSRLQSDDPLLGAEPVLMDRVVVEAVDSMRTAADSAGVRSGPMKSTRNSAPHRSTSVVTSTMELIIFRETDIILHCKVSICMK